MTSIKLAVLRHTRSKDGSYKIRISIGHKSETHYIVTKYKVHNLSNFVNGVVVGQPDAKAINVKLRQLLNEYDARLERVPNPSDYSCEKLRNLLRDMPSSCENYTIQQIADIYCGKLIEENRKSTADLMLYHVRRFLKFTNGDIYLSHLTPRLVDDYVHHLRVSGVSNAYITISVSPLSTLTNYAIKMQYVRYDVSPFAYYKRQESVPRELDLSVEDMRKVFAYNPPQRKMRRTLDLFKLSFMLGGMNMVDMLQYDFRNSDINYVRQKTKRKNMRPTKFSIQPEAREIIDKYMNAKTGRLEILKDRDYDTFMLCFNRSLKTIAKNLELSQRRMCFYSARKSFVQHGFDLGISLEILEYCTGQTMKTNRPIFNYAKIMSTHADAAIRKIIDNINPTILSDNGENKKP